MRCYASKVTLAKLVCIGITMMFLDKLSSPYLTSIRHSNKPRENAGSGAQKSHDWKKGNTNNKNLIDEMEISKNSTIKGSNSQVKDTPKDDASKSSKMTQPMHADQGQKTGDTAQKHNSDPKNAPTDLNKNTTATKILKTIDNEKDKQLHEKTATKTKTGTGVKGEVPKAGVIDNPTDRGKVQPATEPSTTKAASNRKPVRIPDAEILHKMDVMQLEKFYFRYVETPQSLCNKTRRFGTPGTGSYSICEDALKKPCLMYSFGNGGLNETTIDNIIAKQYGCDVHSFSLAPRNANHLSTNLTFHYLKQGAIDSPRQHLMTFDSIQTRLNHRGRTIDILKMDTAAEEWANLPRLNNGHKLNKVKMLMVEFHICSRNCMDREKEREERYIRYLGVLRQIYDAGFRIYSASIDPLCRFHGNKVMKCNILSMVNKNLK